MKKKFNLCSYIAILAILLSSCDQEYPNLLDDKVGIYFQSNAMQYSLGDKPLELEEYTFNIPVKVLGAPSKNKRTFSIKVINNETSSIEGVTHKALKSQYEVLPDSVNAYIPVTLLRTGMSDSENYQITLQIQEGEDFSLGVAENTKTMFVFDNILERPYWWSFFFNIETYAGPYHPKKYQKLISIYGPSVTTIDFFDNRFRILKALKAVKDFFDANPEDGVSFPENVDWPFD